MNQTFFQIQYMMHHDHIENLNPYNKIIETPNEPMKTKNDKNKLSWAISVPYLIRYMPCEQYPNPAGIRGFHFESVLRIISDVITVFSWSFLCRPCPY